MRSVVASTVYNVSFIDAQGQLSLHKVVARNAEEASQEVVKLGATVLRCEADAVSPQNQWLRRFTAVFRRSHAIDMVVFSQDMATLMEAGVSVKEAIDAMHRKETSSSRLDVLGQINTSISQGLSFSAALRKTQAFPELLIATVAASEETGDLSTGLARYARHQHNLRAVQDKVVGACVYPLLLLTVGSIVIALLLGVVVPRFSTLIDSTGKELPLMSKMLMSWGRFVDAHEWLAPLFFLALFAALVGLFTKFRDAHTRKRWLSKIPGVARVVREFQQLQMYRTTAILTSRGIPIHKALGYSLEFLNPQDQLRLKASISAMREGVGVSNALEKAQLADSIAVSMLSVAERTGAMAEMLDRIADFYERSLQRNIDIVSRLIEPILMIIFGVIIGGIVVLMYLPIFDLASSIS